MKVSLKRRIEIAKYIVDNKATDCIGGYTDCCNCPLKRYCGDIDKDLLIEAELWLEGNEEN